MLSVLILVLFEKKSFFKPKILDMDSIIMYNAERFCNYDNDSILPYLILYIMHANICIIAIEEVLDSY